MHTPTRSDSLDPISPPSAAYLGPRSWLPRTPAKDWLLLTRALSRRRCGRTDRDIMERVRAGLPGGGEGGCPAPIRPLKPPPRGPHSVSQSCQPRPEAGVRTPAALVLMTGRPRVTRCRTQRGLGYTPTSCRGAGSACRAGQEGGSYWDPPRAGKGQERGGAREECAEAPVYPGVGRAPQPCPDLLPPSGPGAPTPTPQEAAGGHGAGRGACFEPSGAAWQARPVQVGLPTPARPAEAAPLQPPPAPRRPDARALPMPRAGGFPGWGAVPRSAPPPPLS